MTSHRNVAGTIVSIRGIIPKWPYDSSYFQVSKLFCCSAICINIYIYIYIYIYTYTCICFWPFEAYIYSIFPFSKQFQTTFFSQFHGLNVGHWPPCDFIGKSANKLGHPWKWKSDGSASITTIIKFKDPWLLITGWWFGTWILWLSILYWEYIIIPTD